MTVPIVKTAKQSDEAGVIETLKLAFAADPATRWVWPTNGMNLNCLAQSK